VSDGGLQPFEEALTVSVLEILGSRGDNSNGVKLQVVEDKAECSQHSITLGAE
jgi:hypothetical protein